MEAAQNSLEFTKAENRIRKRWLFFSISLPVCFLIFAIIVSICALFKDLSFVISLPLLIFCLFGFFYIEYYCAYKNPGTIFLLWQIILISLNLLISGLKGIVIMTALCSVSLLTALIVLLAALTISFPVAASLYYAIKLRRINKSMQERRLLTSPVYVEALSVFSMATNLEELNNLFTKLKSSRDWGSEINIVAKAYSKQKKILKSKNNPKN